MYGLFRLVQQRVASEEGREDTSSDGNDGGAAEPIGWRSPVVRSTLSALLEGGSGGGAAAGVAAATEAVSMADVHGEEDRRLAVELGWGMLCHSSDPLHTSLTLQVSCYPSTLPQPCSGEPIVSTSFFLCCLCDVLRGGGCQCNGLSCDVAAA